MHYQEEVEEMLRSLLEKRNTARIRLSDIEWRELETQIDTLKWVLTQESNLE